MIRLIGDEIEIDGVVIARLIPGAGWSTLIAEFTYRLEYLDDLEQENNEQETKIKALTDQEKLTAEDHDKEITAYKEKLLSLVARNQELDERLRCIIAFNDIERTRMQNVIDLQQSVIECLSFTT